MPDPTRSIIRVVGIRLFAGLFAPPPIELKLVAAQLQPGKNTEAAAGSFGRDGNYNCDRIAPEQETGFVAGESNLYSKFFQIENITVVVVDADEILEAPLAAAVRRTALGAKSDGDIDIQSSNPGSLVDVAGARKLDADDFRFEIDVDQIAAGTVAEPDQFGGVSDNQIIRAPQNDGIG